MKNKIIKQYIEKYKIDEDLMDLEESFKILSLMSIDRTIDKYNFEETDVDGSNDCGIDNIVFKLNGNIINNIEELNLVGKGAKIEVTLVQLKYSEKLKEEHLNKFIHGVKYFLDCADKVANDNIKKYKNMWKKIMEGYASFSPDITFKVVFATMSKNDKFEKNEIKFIINEFKELISENSKASLFNNKSEFKLLALNELFNSFKRILENNPDPQEVVYTEIIKKIAHLDKDEKNEFDSFVMLTSFNELYKLVAENIDNIYMENVRHFLNGSNVNKGIGKRISNEDEKMDFWVFNNGITLLADKVVLQEANKKIVISNPKIIDGLQSSYSIFKSLADGSMQEERKKEIFQREILIKVVSNVSDEIKEDIIKSNNDRNKVSSVNFLSMDENQKYIENEFRKRGFYYERIMNLHTNGGIESSKIIRPIDLAIAYNTLKLCSPSKSRNSKITLISREANKKKIFNQVDKNMNSYENSYMIYKILEKRLNDYATKNSKYIDDSENSHMLIKKHKFHLMVFLLKILNKGELNLKLFNKREYYKNKIFKEITDSDIKKSINQHMEYIKHHGIKDNDVDKFIKNPPNDKKFNEYIYKK